MDSFASFYTSDLCQSYHDIIKNNVAYHLLIIIDLNKLYTNSYRIIKTICIFNKFGRKYLVLKAFVFLFFHSALEVCNIEIQRYIF